MGDWLRHIALNAKAKTGFGPSLVVWFSVALVGLGLGLVFLCVAAFVWLADRTDAVTAGLILTGLFFLIAIVAAFAGRIARLRNIERARRELAARSHAGWFDPKFLAVGIEIGRTLGWRRIVTLAAVGLMAAGLGKEWFGSGERKPDSREPDAD
jgi:Putative Actinobacterial Holin-X, holin superfamily III